MRFRHVSSTFLLLGLLLWCAFPQRLDAAARTRTRLSLGWKFHRGDAGNGASGASFDDGGWETVCVPHAASYQAPNFAGESKHYRGVVWYRRRFDLPSLDDKRVFLEFEAAMQVAEVWVNGTKVGTHDNCGYTGFSFDVTDQVDPGESNVVAVRLDNNRSKDIPPGVGQPDYYLFGGLYRDVWLVVTSNVQVPYCGIRITTPTVSRDEAVVKVETLVRNAGGASRTCTVQTDIVDGDGDVVTTMTGDQEIAAGEQRSFVQQSEGLDAPHLWSTDNPYLYTSVTTVRDGDEVLDGTATRFGIRTIEWTTNNGFLLNGERCEIRGVNFHQSFAWVGNASPNCRLRADVEAVKDIGANAIRCSHYPRDPAFYDACDELGILAYPEVPTYGAGTYSYTDAFWQRLKKCGEEMVAQGFNHPSIVLWGMFNEAWADFPAGIRGVNDAIRALDTTRPTAVATISHAFSHLSIPGVVGLNYNTGGNANWKIVNTEYHISWTGSVCLRGQSCEDSYAATKWENWANVASAEPRLAGGFMWVFCDYNSDMPTSQGKGKGVLDHYRIPKKAYYLFRERWTGKASDAAAGGSATRIELTADVPRLQANGSDISRVLATLRDGSGRCIDTERGISFSVDGPVTVFDDLQRTTIDGRIGIVVRATTDDGTAVIRASSQGLESDEIEIPVAPFSEEAVSVAPPVTPAYAQAGLVAPAAFCVRRLATGPVISYSLNPLPSNMHYAIGLFDARGRTVYRGRGRRSGVLRLPSTGTQVYLMKAEAVAK
jgi:hypothetical protein